MEENFNFWATTADFIHYCDDCIIKLDNILFKLCDSDLKSSIYQYALSEQDSVISKSFWHCNFAAFRQFKESNESGFDEFLKSNWITPALPFSIPYNAKKLLEKIILTVSR